MFIDGSNTSILLRRNTLKVPRLIVHYVYLLCALNTVVGKSLRNYVRI